MREKTNPKVGYCCGLPHDRVHGRLTGLHLDSAPSALAQPRLRGCASELMTLGALSRY